MSVFSCISLIGGLVFFLFGMHVLSGSLEKSSGGRLERLLGRVSGRPAAGMALGALITMAVQSSSATTVMLVGLVNSGLMTLSQTLYVIYGANVGTTATAWLLSLAGIRSDSLWLLMLKPENFAPLLALPGILMVMLSKSDRKQNIGTTLVGFAVLIYGMKMMADAVSPLATLPEFTRLLAKFHNPLTGMLAGTLFTAVIQSSAAAIGILQSLALTGSLTNTMAVPLIMGANIGTCITSMIACIGTNRQAQRVAWMHLTVNVLGTAFWLPVYGLVSRVTGGSFGGAAANPASIAFLHTLFNLLTVFLLLPFTRLLERLVCRIIRDGGSESDAGGLHLDERLLRSPAVAVIESNAATARMCMLAQENVRLAMELFHCFDETRVALIQQNEETLDVDEDVLSTFLVQLSEQALSRKNSQIVSKMQHAIGNFERLGDHALNLVRSAREIHEKGIVFSEQAGRELAVLEAAIGEILQLTADAYVQGDLALAARVEPLEQVIDGLTSRIRGHHLDRLRRGSCTAEMGFVLSDILTNYERISDHCSNVAVAIIEVAHNSFDTHKYLNGIKSGNDAFDTVYAAYAAKYRLPLL